jgi:cyanobactin maturation PatA/PatG family protease
MEGDSPNPDDPRQLLEFLDGNPEYADSLIWILELESTPIYAIRPFGPYASLGYERLRMILRSQLEESTEKVSVPGYVAGTKKLLSGQTVPAIIPELRGIYNWSVDELIKSVVGTQGFAHDEKGLLAKEGLHNFLSRIYFEMMNLGRASQERAINFAATNAFQAENVFAMASKDKMVLESISAEPSTVCRPGSDCWDVKLIFFDPANRLTVARKLYRFTVDVSDVIPVSIGSVRSWSIY